MQKVKKESRFINREISWLSFNERVLQEADDERNPLLQRVRFLGIFSNNLDEFFRVRVATMRRLVDIGKQSKIVLGDMTPQEVLDQIQKTVMSLQERFQSIYERLLRELDAVGVHVIDELQLDSVQGPFARDYFTSELSPLIVPIMLSKDKSFPYLRDKAIYLAVKMTVENRPRKTRYALLEVPVGSNPRFVVLPKRKGLEEDTYIIIADDIIRYCLDDIFFMFEYDKIEAYTIKITRDAELDIDDDISMSFMEKMAKSLKERRKGQPVRMVYDERMPPDLYRFITKQMELDDDDNLIPGGIYHNFKDFIKFPSVDNELEIHNPPALVHRHVDVHKSIMQVIRERDILLHYPYQTFNHFIDLLREAAVDPQVISISITLYRVADRSKVINALINAAKNGKRVTVLIELLARFDEKANLRWSEKLSEAGVRVIHGVPGLKVHSKIALIHRKEQGRIKSFAYIGTGNFHEGTSNVYCDEGLFTTNRHLAAEVTKIFEFLKHNYKRFNYRHLVVSPYSMRKQFMQQISTEIKNARLGKPAYILLKLNNLVDQGMINHLYSASKAGVKIKLIVRGICSLKAGVKGMSDNIEGISIVDKYLEHSRFIVFANGGDEQYFITSADWMTRNLDHRVEVACPVYDKEIQKELRAMFDIQWRDNTKARVLDAYQQNKYRQTRAKKKHRAQIEYYTYLKNLK
ncbi:MAG TPA: polyphosphate kinase 1 [Salinivirga sp.]|uniref:polyphosphate kinase 1 n=1 Tax=Salinivirga sp. TaxID=1970192 RepID=UPI002B483A06|nr:polyphosphate kinase 1 [Salinivirga sp.]HKK59343.1 polyphosphate kinase 1 [Salinivirga sp.]